MPAVARVERRQRAWLRWGWRIAFGAVLGAWGVLLLAWLTLHWAILPRIEQWRPQIESQASRALGLNVRIGAIRVRSGGWVPALELSDLAVQDRHGREALRLPKVSAAISARSLLALRPRFEQLHIEGANLEVRRDLAGRLHVAGIEVGGAADSAGSSDLADWFFDQHEFVVRHGRLRWIDEQRGGAALELEQVDVVVRNGLRSHAMRLDATPPAGWGERFSLQGRFTQSLLQARGDWRHWSGTLHAALPHVDVTQLRRHVALPFELNEGRGALRAWIELRDGLAQSATADLALRGVSTRLAAALPALELAEVQGRVRAERRRGSLALAAEGLSFLTADGQRWPQSRVELTLREREGLPAAAARDAGLEGLAADPLSDRWAGGELSADGFDLAVGAAIAARLPLGQPAIQALASWAPSGRVSRLSARWDGSLAAPDRYQIKARAEGLSVAAAAAARADAVGRPGWRNATVELDANEKGGSARVVLDQGALILPGVFEVPAIPFDSFSTQLAWRLRTPSGRPAGSAPEIEIDLADTRFANADAQGELSVARWRTGNASPASATAVPRAAPAGTPAGATREAHYPGHLELVGSLSRGRAAAVARYLPLGVHSAARAYVAGAVLDGRLAGASFKVKGDLSAFPFAAVTSTGGARPPAGEFRIAARAQDVTLAYVPGQRDAAPAWPAFTQVNGDLVFERNGMQIRNASGRVFGVELARIEGSISDLERPVLRIEGQGRGPAADLLRYVQATPVAGWIDQALGEASASGAAELNLRLELPIDELERSTVQGRVLLAGNDVRLAERLPLMAAAKARIDFNQRGFSIAGASARILGSEVTFEGGQQADGSMRFQGQGSVSAEALRRNPELGALSRLAGAMSGQTTYRLALGVVRGHLEVNLSSPLTGLALDLPAPLKKAADASWPLRIESRLLAASGGSALGAPQLDSLRVELATAVQAQFVRDLSKPTPVVLQGALAVLDALPPLPERGVHAVLNLGNVDVDAWQVLAERLLGPSVAAVAGSPAVDGGYLPRTVALRAQSLASGGRRLTQLVAGVSQDASDGTWRGSVDADQLGGYVEYRAARGAANPGRVYARLARLALPPADVDSVENLLVQAPASVPALDIVIDDFELRGRKFGRVEIEAVNRAGEGAVREWRLGRLAVSNADAVLSGSGQWQPGPGAGRQRMVMDFKLDLLDTGGALARLGFGGTLRGGKGRMAGQVSWAGSPLSLHTPSLDGRINLAIDAGQFLKAGPGAGRLLSVLSLQALPRRLLLDFRDVFQEGFAFDTITGDVDIDDGVARTNNLRMRGLQAAVLMEGSADIERETQNLHVLVVPEINLGTAALAYAVINPAVGLGSFLAQLFLRRPLMAASTREFNVQGSWAEPKVERIERKLGAPLPDLDPPAAAVNPASAPAAAARP